MDPVSSPILVNVLKLTFYLLVIHQKALDFGSFVYRSVLETTYIADTFDFLNINHQTRDIVRYVHSNIYHLTLEPYRFSSCCFCVLRSLLYEREFLPCNADTVLVFIDPHGHF